MIGLDSKLSVKRLKCSDVPSGVTDNFSSIIDLLLIFNLILLGVEN